jgi:hypothetical protein
MILTIDRARYAAKHQSHEENDQESAADLEDSPKEALSEEKAVRILSKEVA